jgi:glycosyltransferase involved in cell wall biosynthesis
LTAARRARVGLVLVGAGDLTGGGGAERYFADLFLAWHRGDAPSRACELWLITDAPTRLRLAEIGRALPREQVIELPRYTGWRGRLAQGRALRRLARNGSFDLLHLSQALPRHLPWLWSLACCSRRARITVNLNDYEIARALESGRPARGLDLAWRAYLAYFSNWTVDGFMVWYQRLVAPLAALRAGRGTPIHAANYCFVDTAQFVPSNEKRDEVVFAGRLVAVKRPELFIDAIAAARRRAPALVARWRFVLLGKGPLEAGLRRQAAEAGLGDQVRIDFAERVGERLAHSRIFVSTQDEENFTSLAMLEAMACGNAIVARNVGQTRAFVREGENGRLVDAADAESVAEAMLAIMADPALQRRMGEESRRITLEEHCVEHALAEFDDFWLALAERRRRPRPVDAIPGPDVRVLVVIGQLDIGGAERHLALLLPRLREAGIGVTLCTLRAGGALEPLLRAGGVRVIGPACGIRGFPSTLCGLWRLVREAWSTRPAILHCFLPAAYLLGNLATVGLPTRRVMSRRSLAHYQAKYPGLRALERLLHRRMDAVLGNSRAVVDELRAEGVPAERLGLIHNGVPVPASPPTREDVRTRLDIAADALVLICVANLIGYKGHRDLLEALAAIRERMPPGWVLLLVGRDDGIGAALRAQAEQTGLRPHIRFIGGVPEVADYLAAADIGVLASHEEGFSNAILEGMAAGLPMVVTDVGGNAEAVIDGDCGRVVPARAPGALGAALLDLAMSAELRTRFGERARARVRERFSEQRCVQSYLALYSNLARGVDPAIPPEAACDGC